MKATAEEPDARSRADRGLRRGAGSVLGVPSFRNYWAAVAVSQAGSAVTVVVIPLLAATVLHASPIQMSLLAAVGTVMSLILQIWIAVWADRTTNHIKWLIALNIASALTVSMIPLLWEFGHLTFGLLVLVMVIAEVFAVTRSAVGLPVMVKTVPKEHLIEANGVLNGTASAVEIVGKSLGGLLLAVMAAPLALLVDAASYVFSSMAFAKVRARDAPTGGSNADAKSVRSDLRALRGMGRSLLARRDIWCLISIAMTNGLTESVFVLYCLHSLGMPAPEVSVLLGIGAIGGILGGAFVGKASRSFGGAKVVLVAALLTIAAVLPLPFAGRGISGILAVVGFELFGALGGTAAVATIFGNVQQSAPDGTVARTMTMAGNLLQTSALVGLAIGGAVGETFSVHSGILLASSVALLTILPIAVKVQKTA